MRTWTYSYKTSDGLRHEAEMSAPSKDDVYAELRRQGIRAIRVDERIAPIVRRGFSGLRKRDWAICAAVLVGLLSLVFLVPRDLDGRTQNAESRAAPFDLPGDSDFKNLSAAVNEAMEGFRASFESVDRELLANYRLVMNMSDTAEFRREIERGRKAIEDGRAAIKGVYQELYEKIPSERTESVEAAQKLYGLAMDEIDAAAESLDGDECAIELLTRNKGKWCVVRGEVQWSDDRLAREFMVFRRSGLSATARNRSRNARPQKDFQRSPLTRRQKK